MKSLRFLKIIFFFAASILVSTATISFITGQRFVEASHWVMRAHEVISQLELVHGNVEDVEAGIQALLSTGEVPDLTNFQDALLGLPQELKKLRRMVGPGCSTAATWRNRWSERSRALPAAQLRWLC